MFLYSLAAVCLATIAVILTNLTPSVYRDIQETKFGDVIADLDIVIDNPNDPDWKPEKFFFGLATAPGHVEDQLDDAWLDFAERGGVAAYHNYPRPEERLRFWTEPEREIELAARSGVGVFRLGLEWGRIMVKEPKNNSLKGCIDKAALKRYREILEMVKAKNMKVMLTLFHHAAPKWAGEYGGWTEDKTVDYFIEFTKLVKAEMGDLVDYWVTFNEPHIFLILVHCLGAWPPGFNSTQMGQLACLTPWGGYGVSLDNIAAAHNHVYPLLKETGAPVGVAHHVGWVVPSSLFEIPLAAYGNWLSLYRFVDLIAEKADFIGLNYYGQEFLGPTGVVTMSDQDYSDSGRAIYPDGLYHLLKRYHARFPNATFIVTENGVSDGTDAIRPSYLVEHLLAVRAAISKGVPVAGYIWWTISDNWEWADGYCPLFGLYSVDRDSENLTRVPRPSLKLFDEIVRTGQVTGAQRDAAWKKADDAFGHQVPQPFCRDLVTAGGTGAHGLDSPADRLMGGNDWRFGHYRSPKWTDPISRGARYLLLQVKDNLEGLIKWYKTTEMGRQMAEMTGTDIGDMYEDGGSEFEGGGGGQSPWPDSANRAEL